MDHKAVRTTMFAKRQRERNVGERGRNLCVHDGSMCLLNDATKDRVRNEYKRVCRPREERVCEKEKEPMSLPYVSSFFCEISLL